MDHSIGSPSVEAAPESIALAVVEAIAEREAVDPIDLDRPLYDVIDPDALENLFRVDAAGRSICSGHVTFAYGDYLVRVSSDREISVFGRGDVGSGPAGPGGD